MCRASSRQGEPTSMSRRRPRTTAAGFGIECRPSRFAGGKGDPVKCGARIALGVAGGYFLGRTKKMKLALMLGGMAAGRQTGGPAQLLQQGAKLLGQSPELGRLTDEIRGRLLEAGKGAAVAVATRQVEALTDRLVSQVGTATEAGGRTVSDASERTGQAARTVSGLGRRRPRQEADSDGHDEEESDRYEDEPAEDRVGEEPEAEEEAPEVEDEAAEAEEEAPEVEDEAAEDDRTRRGRGRAGRGRAGRGRAGRGRAGRGGGGATAVAPP